MRIQIKTNQIVYFDLFWMHYFVVKQQLLCSNFELIMENDWDTSKYFGFANVHSLI